MPTLEKNRNATEAHLTKKKARHDTHDTTSYGCHKDEAKRSRSKTAKLSGASRRKHSHLFSRCFCIIIYYACIKWEMPFLAISRND